MADSRVWRERDSPEIARSIVMLDKLNPVARESLRGRQLCDHTGRHLNAKLIA